MFGRVRWVLDEPDSAKARALRDDFRRQIHDLIAPDMLPLEVGHALTRAERQGRISQLESLNLWADMRRVPLGSNHILV